MSTHNIPLLYRGFKRHPFVEEKKSVEKYIKVQNHNSKLYLVLL